MRRMLIPLVVSFLLLVSFLAAPLTYVAAHDEDEREAESELDDPGNNPGSPTGVTAEIEFEDDGTTLTITGEAEGLTPGVPYASLIYDIGSSAEGPFACEPAFFGGPDSIITTMFIGFWVVDEDGEGELSEINIIDDDTGMRVYVPLSKIGTVSIRDLTVPNPGPPFFDGSGPAAVVACGVVEVEDDEEDEVDVEDEEAELEDPGNYFFGPSGVTGVIFFVDDGTTLTITGTATGLTLGIPYASLIYDKESEDDGPEACEPAIFDPAEEGFILPTMFIGFWIVAPDGTGTLSAINIVDDATGMRVYVPLDLIGTVSIRDLTVPNPGPPFFDGSGPAAVVACGEL